MVTDLTKGNPDKTLWKFTLPMIITCRCRRVISHHNAFYRCRKRFKYRMLCCNLAVVRWKTHYAYENGCQYLYYLISYFISYTDCSRSFIIKSAFKGNGNTG